MQTKKKKKPSEHSDVELTTDVIKYLKCFHDSERKKDRKKENPDKSVSRFPFESF